MERCGEGEGDCEDDDECEEGLVCGEDNCKKFSDDFHEEDDCCVEHYDGEKFMAD